MSAGKHTPGPWTYVIGKSLLHVEVDAAAPHIDGIHFLAGQAICSLPKKAEANARLIAAAPELLEACKKLVEWNEREKDHAISFMERVNLCNEAFLMMDAAIAKADGREV